jgi:hypothetical protein
VGGRARRTEGRRQDATALVGLTLQRRRGVRRAGHALRQDPWGLRPQIQGRRILVRGRRVDGPVPCGATTRSSGATKRSADPTAPGQLREDPRLVCRGPRRGRGARSASVPSLLRAQLKAPRERAQDALTTTRAVQARQSADRLAHAWHTERLRAAILPQPCALASTPLSTRNDGVRGSSPRVGLLGRGSRCKHVVSDETAA